MKKNGINFDKKTRITVICEGFEKITEKIGTFFARNVPKRGPVWDQHQKTSKNGKNMKKNGINFDKKTRITVICEGFEKITEKIDTFCAINVLKRGPVFFVKGSAQKQN